MFIAKKHISRRTMLRGRGVGIALPFLDSMVPAQTPPRKTPHLHVPGWRALRWSTELPGSKDEGASKHYWSPSKDGADFDFSYSLEPLAPFREYITIVSGTDARTAEAVAPSEGGADHFRSSAVYLTAAHAKQTDISNGISIDQLRAAARGYAFAIGPSASKISA
jgi:hypothetical protein